MENLTKQQIVLVTLLVSFVTSIATGIVTVALMEQAPPGVTQTINRVVEKTIETVVQVPAQSAAVVTKETVVVKADDLVVAAVEKNTPSITRILKKLPDTAEVAAVGIIINKDGLLVADLSALEADAEYIVSFDQKVTYPVEIAHKDSANNLAFLSVKVPAGEKINVTPVAFSDSNVLKLGQTLVFLGGAGNNAVETGIISSLKTENAKTADAATSTEPAAKKVTEIISTLGVGNGIHGIVMNLSAEAVGFRIQRDGRTFILPSNILLESLESYRVSQATAR